MPKTPIYCRPILESDVTDRYLSWFKDPLVTRYLEAKDLSRDEVLAFIANGRGITRFMDAICLQGNDLHVGNVKIDVNWRHSVASLSIVIGDKQFWEKGIGTEAIRQMTTKAFNQLRIRKLTGGLFAVNLGSLKCFEKAGWRLDSISRDQWIFEGMPIDGITMSALNPGVWGTNFAHLADDSS
jgi:[ribosomal protein S5]-alanine N-acetyltransferase